MKTQSTPTTPFFLRKSINLLSLLVFTIFSFTLIQAQFCTFQVNASLFRPAGCNGAAGGSLALSVNPGGTYLYLITQDGLPTPMFGFFDTTTVINDIPPGDYGMFITLFPAPPIAQCEIFFSIPLASVTPGFSIIGFPNPCQCDGSISLSVASTSNLRPPIHYTYTLQSDNGYSNSILTDTTSASFGNLCGGNYSWTIQATDSSTNGCTASTAGGASLPGGGPTPVASITGNTSYNIGDTVNLFGHPSSVTPPGPGLTYHWTGPNAFDQTTQDVSFTATTASAGTYQLTVCNPSNGTQCCSSTSVDITVECRLAVNMETITIPCQGQNNGIDRVTITTGTPPFTYTLDGGTQVVVQNNSFDLSGLAAGKHTLSITDSATPQCVFMTEFTLQPACCLQTTLSNIQPSCANAATGSVDITISGQTGSVSYSTDGGMNYTSVDTNPFTVGHLPAGMVTILVKDASVPPCSPVSNTITVGSFPALNVQITGNVNLCGSENPMLAAVVSGGGGEPYQFKWSPSGETTQNISITGPGDYSVKVTDSKGCSNEDSVTVGEQLMVNIEPNQPGICAGKTITLTAVPAPAGNYTYSWTCCGDSTVLSNTASINVTKPGLYTVVVTDPNHIVGCSTTVSTQVSTIPQADCGQISLTVCCKKCVPANGQTTLTVTVTNTGHVALDGITVSDFLPDCFTFIKGIGINREWNFIGGQTVIANLVGTLQPREATSFTLYVNTHCDPCQQVVNRIVASNPRVTPMEAQCCMKVN